MKGKFLRHTEKGMIYGYDCPVCRKPYESRAPEESEPLCCHGCFTGTRLKSGKRRRGAAHCQGNIRRKAKHTHKGENN